MEPQLRRSTRHVYRRRGRAERWDDDAVMWLVVETGGKKRVGSPYRIHEWDINDRFAPLEEPT